MGFPPYHRTCRQNPVWKYLLTTKYVEINTLKEPRLPYPLLVQYQCLLDNRHLSLLCSGPEQISLPISDHQSFSLETLDLSAPGAELLLGSVPLGGPVILPHYEPAPPDFSVTFSALSIPENTITMCSVLDSQAALGQLQEQILTFQAAMQC